jgi:DNA-binding GntR family transcriptional regulator
MILTGVLPPDGKLKIDDLRAELDTGASPIREALSLLTSDQLVVRQDQKGFRTAATSPENFQEILELRCSLEEMALRQSVAGATSAWEEALVLAHHRMTRAIGESVDIFEARHKDFHMALINNCDMPLLLRFCDQLYDLNIRYRYSAGRSSGYIGRDVATEHADIIAAVIDHDADVAANLLKTHYTKTGAFLRDHL